MPTSLPAATTEADFDSDISSVNGGLANTAYTVSLQGPITITASQTLTPQTGSSLEIDGPGSLAFNSTQALFVTSGTLTLVASVSGDAYTQATPAATIVLNSASLVNGSPTRSGSNQILSGSVVTQAPSGSASSSVDNFGQIVVTAAGSTAVFMDGGDGEAVTNESTGTIDGGLAGVVFSGAGTLTNSGTVGGPAAGYGVYFETSGTVVNGSRGITTPALIEGVTNGVLVTAAGTVTNDAAILATGAGSAGVVMASGTVINDSDTTNAPSQGASTAISIKGGEYGVLVSGGSATITNLGTILATDSSGTAPSNAPIAGISLLQGGTVYNGFTAGFFSDPYAVTSGADYGVLVQGATGTVANSGTISGKIAISFTVAGTVQNNGAITSTDGAGGTAIQFGSGSSLLQLGSGFTITGKVEGGSGSGDTTTLEVFGGTVGTFTGLSGGSGTISNGFAFDHVSTIGIDAGATWSFSGANALTNLSLNGEADVAAGGTLEIATSATGTGTIGLGSNASLVIDTSSGFGANQGDTANYTGDVIAQFAVGNSIDLRDVAFSASTTMSFGSNTLQLSDGTHTADLRFASASGFTRSANFLYATDGSGGTVVTVACYCPGTLIATPDGEVAVEDLAIGDLVATIDGRPEPIRWIGLRSYGGRFLTANPKMQPVRFRAGSLGDGLPRRDLLVSPEHAMLLDGLLVPARCLVNGGSIVREHGMPAVDYIHIELAEHDVILAEGAASETFIDDDSRRMFENASEFDMLYPAAAPAAGFCARRVEDGYELEAIRQRLAALGWFAEAA